PVVMMLVRHAEPVATRRSRGLVRGLRAGNFINVVTNMLCLHRSSDTRCSVPSTDRPRRLRVWQGRDIRQRCPEIGPWEPGISRAAGLLIHIEEAALGQFRMSIPSFAEERHR